MNSVKIKICGITNPIDAHQAVDAGADALGFVFYKNSPRCVSANVVKSIIANLPPFVLPVGVFVNEDAATVRTIMDDCGLAFAQIHGDETADFCEGLGRPVLRGIRLRDQNTLMAMAEYKGRARVRAFVLDAFSDTAYGGTGKTADWTLAKEAAQSFSFLLAGGLTPDNVQEAIQQVQPYGIDVSSGVEASPGKKDPAKVQEFIQAAKLNSN
ncbi:phosphoribosylanthranilate isomerase [Candidatus Nitronereus thalassa]|uniref:N-(5'-phosphoribosyl)anthranilate isomerase n=1 Tax=Candidatus Nitronereus thalassa TaxID=3020898 RepID=A0ABU3K4L8_9BACT|nr:phosphoribosylanthranilate isomerase [Candidatus Nitronereus thalassa]MDT7041342.1 phosphoribosylanthranilate isomerase [Candidatus Nitronereus thalassa]